MSENDFAEVGMPKVCFRISLGIYSVNGYMLYMYVTMQDSCTGIRNSHVRFKLLYLMVNRLKIRDLHSI